MQKYKIKRALGNGSFGTVFQALSPNQEVVAIKKMKQKYKDWEECCTLRQIKSLKKLDHPNIIKLKEVILANGQLYMVFDFLETNLLEVYSRAKDSGRTFTQSQIKGIFYKMAQGLAYFHKNGYFHRDLKPENILCHNLDVKICDFGLARQIRSRPPFTDYVSTRWYRAPELLLRSNSYNSPVDIFALGCIVVELFTMKPLFPGENQIDMLNKIVEVLGTPKKSDWPQGYKLASAIRYDFPQAKGKGLFEIIPNASIQMVELLQSMLCYSSRKRPSANEILKHSYFEGYAPIYDKQGSQNQELKVSFYDKNIVQIPKNIKIENSKQVQMRKSLIKFGQSFTSSFHKQKKEPSNSNIGNLNNKQTNPPVSVKKIEKKEEEEYKKQQKSNKKQSVTNVHTNIFASHEKQKQKQRNGNSHNSASLKKGKFSSQDDQDISKKFDEMEEILNELKRKQQMKSTNSYNYKQKQKQKSYEGKYNLTSHLQPINQQQQLRLRMFSLDGGIAGTKSISNMNLISNINGNMKTPSLKGPLSLNNNFKSSN